MMTERLDVVQEQINKAFQMGVAFERERCAQVAERYGYKHAAACIRAGDQPLPDISK